MTVWLRASAHVCNRRTTTDQSVYSQLDLRRLRSSSIVGQTCMPLELAMVYNRIMTMFTRKSHLAQLQRFQRVITGT